MSEQFTVTGFTCSYCGTWNEVAEHPGGGCEDAEMVPIYSESSVPTQAD